LSETKLLLKHLAEKGGQLQRLKSKHGPSLGPGSLPPIFIKVHGTQQGPPFGHILAGTQSDFSLFRADFRGSGKYP